MNFSVTNPPPVITTLSPTSATAGGAAFTLTVNGTGFVNGAVVSFNGAAKTTTFGSATQLTLEQWRSFWVLPAAFAVVVLVFFTALFRPTNTKS